MHHLAYVYALGIYVPLDFTESPSNPATWMMLQAKSGQRTVPSLKNSETVRCSDNLRLMKANRPVPCLFLHSQLTWIQDNSMQCFAVTTYSPGSYL